VVVTVVRIDGNTVGLGIEAPQHVPVFREELLPAPRSDSSRGSDSSSKLLEPTG
jgi:carbon storage regulator